MFRPNTTASLLRKSGRNIHGRESYAPAVSIPCAVVSLAERVVDSSVRADSSASRGTAEIDSLQAIILIPPTIAIAKGDVLKVSGRLVEVSSIEPRNDIFGRLHHQEIRGNLKGDM